VAAVSWLALLILAGYPWLPADGPRESVGARIPPPAGFVREALPADSFGEWLRGLPLRPGRPAVHLFDGRLKVNQEAHAAVLDIDVGTRDLQQCADAVMRLRAEYLFASGRGDRVAFHFTSGDNAEYSRWARGDRPTVHGSTVRWSRSARPEETHRSFRRYLDVVFMYAGSSSLARELQPLDVSALAPGDVFIRGGFPGHAVLVLDTARDERTGRRAFLLAQSYMPAQEIHVLRNPARSDPWYLADFGETLVTPEWTFARRELMRFPPLR
jgi:hypothetical protein